MSNTCVMCGCEIPEGIQVCPACVAAAVGINPAHAHWYINPDGYYPQCSNCWEEPRSGELEATCPNCGAIMEGAS